MAVIPKTAGPLTTGKEIQVANLSPTAAGTESVIFSIDAESVLLSLYVEAVSGDLDVKAYTVGADGQEVEIISFPTISAPTNELLLRKAASALQRIRVEVTYTDACTFNLRARGVAAEGASVKIEGASSFQVTQVNITTTASALLSAGLTDRNGIMVVNTDPSQTLYIAESLAKATAGLGAPVYPNGGNISLDLAAGGTLYAVSTAGTIDVRIVETGG